MRPAKIEAYKENSSNYIQKLIEKIDELKSLLMHSNNAAENKNQLAFYLRSITAKFENKTQYDQVATARTPTPSESVC